MPPKKFPQRYDFIAYKQNINDIVPNRGLLIKIPCQTITYVNLILVPE